MKRPENSIAELVASQGSFELAWNTEAAYQHFSGGGVIISDDVADLEDFAEKNKTEFLGDQIERGQNGTFRYFDAMGQRFYFTYHKHKSREVYTSKLAQFQIDSSD